MQSSLVRVITDPAEAKRASITAKKDFLERLWACGFDLLRTTSDSWWRYCK